MLKRERRIPKRAPELSAPKADEPFSGRPSDPYFEGESLKSPTCNPEESKQETGVSLGNKNKKTKPLIQVLKMAFSRICEAKEALAASSLYASSAVCSQGVKEAGARSLREEPFNSGFYSAIRSAFASILLYPIARKALPNVGRKEWVLAGLAAVANTAWMAAYAWTDVTSAVAISYSFPILVSAREWLSGQMPRKRDVASIALAGSALGLLFYQGIRAGGANLGGNLAAVCAAGAWAAYISRTKSTAESNPTAVPAISFLGNVLSVPAGIAFGLLPFLPGGFGPAANALPFFTFALLNGVTSAGGLYLVTKAGSKTDAVRLSFIALFELPLVPLLKQLFWQSPSAPLAVIGNFMIFGASAIALLGGNRKSRE